MCKNIYFSTHILGNVRIWDIFSHLYELHENLVPANLLVSLAENR